MANRTNPAPAKFAANPIRANPPATTKSPPDIGAKATAATPSTKSKPANAVNPVTILSKGNAPRTTNGIISRLTATASKVNPAATAISCPSIGDITIAAEANTTNNAVNISNPRPNISIGITDKMSNGATKRFSATAKSNNPAPSRVICGATDCIAFAENATIVNTAVNTVNPCTNICHGILPRSNSGKTNKFKATAISNNPAANAGI